MIKFGVLCSFLLFYTLASFGQSKDTLLIINSKVAYLSSNQLYITSGTSAGIFSNDTIYVSVQNSIQAAYRVVSSSTKSALLQPIQSPLLLTIGQDVQLSFTKQQQKTDKIVEIEQRNSILGNRQKYSIKVAEAQVSARYFMSLSSFGSRTLWNEHIKEAFYRFNAQPQAGYILHAANLTGGFELNLNTRMDYRYYSKAGINEPFQFRIYDFNIRKEFKKSRISLEAGRFNNDYDSFSGFWDGMLVRFGNQQSGLGIIAGSEPIRSSELMNIHQPKFSAFVYHSFILRNFNSSSAISFTQLRPESGFLHNYLGINQRLGYRNFTLSANAQVDRNPSSKIWTSSFISVQARQKLPNRVSLFITYARREPYNIWLSQPFGTVNQRMGGGFSLNFSKFNFGNEVNFNQIESSNSAWSYSNWLQWHKLTRFEIDYQISSQYWQSYQSFSISSLSQLSKYVGSNLIMAGYQFNYSNFYDSISHTHGLFANYQHSLSRKSQLSVRFSVDAGLLLIRTGFYVSYWRTF